MSDFNKTKQNKQIGRPAEMFPDLVDKLAKSTAIARMQHDNLNAPEVAKDLGVSKQSFNLRVQKWMEILGGQHE